MKETVLFVLIGYFAGGILFARVFCTLFGKREAYKNGDDRFRYGGFFCGLLTLIFDVAKAFLPVFLYCRLFPEPDGWGLPLVMAAPILGHVFPVFYRFHGGKGISATFGSLTGLLPYAWPLFWLCASFLFLSLFVRISPHFYRTLAAYLLTLPAMMISGVSVAVWSGFLLMATAVCIRLFLSREEKKKPEVKLLWMR